MPNHNLTYRRIFALSLPVIFANITLPIQGLIDIAIIGHLDSPDYLSAVGLAAQLFALLFVSFNFLQYATSGLAAQAQGANNTPKLQRILWRALLLAVLIGALLILLQPLWLLLGNSFFAPQDRIRDLFNDYYHVRIFSAPFELANYAFIGWFAGQGRPSDLFRQQLMISVSNVMLNLLFVMILGWDVTGVALGTLLANVLGTAYALRLATRSMGQLHLFDWQRLIRADEIVKLLRLNRDIWIRTTLLALSFAWITRLSTQQGELILAANVILLQLLTLSAFAIDGIAVTTESQVGQAYGRSDTNQLKHTVKLTSNAALVTAALISLIFLLIQPVFLPLMTDLAEVRITAKDYYYFAATVPLIAVFAYQFDGVMFGLTANAEIRNSMLLVAAVFFPISDVLALYWGNIGVWLSLYLFFLLRGGILYWQYRRRFR